MAKQTPKYQALSDILKELEIDVPVLNIKISGNKVIIYLYGGRIVEYNLQPAVSSQDSGSEQPEEKPLQAATKGPEGASPKASAPEAAKRKRNKNK
jgi:hypothetical protein